MLRQPVTCGNTQSLLRAAELWEKESKTASRFRDVGMTHGRPAGKPTDARRPARAAEQREEPHAGLGGRQVDDPEQAVSPHEPRVAVVERDFPVLVGGASRAQDAGAVDLNAIDGEGARDVCAGDETRRLNHFWMYNNSLYHLFHHELSKQPNTACISSFVIIEVVRLLILIAH